MIIARQRPAAGRGAAARQQRSSSTRRSTRSASSASKLLPLFSRKQDWDRDARVLTDQYSPANLLNLGALSGSGVDAAQLIEPRIVQFLSASITSCSCGRSPPAMFSS